ncbi:MAG: hypothetical protein CM15mP77_3450 [Synechococcus sp.]|nr:MAG: hypothetical protein CM15mP77_3450 [Synechococcus sp.]
MGSDGCNRSTHNRARPLKTPRAWPSHPAGGPLSASEHTEMAAFSRTSSQRRHWESTAAPLHQSFDGLHVAGHRRIQGWRVPGHHQSMQRASPQLHPHQITGLQTKRCISAVGESPALRPASSHTSTRSHGTSQGLQGSENFIKVNRLTLYWSTLRLIQREDTQSEVRAAPRHFDRSETTPDGTELRSQRPHQRSPPQLSIDLERPLSTRHVRCF